MLHGTCYIWKSGSHSLPFGPCLNWDMQASPSPMAVKRSQLERVHSQHRCINVYLKAGGQTWARPLMGMVWGKSLASPCLLHGQVVFLCNGWGCWQSSLLHSLQYCLCSWEAGSGEEWCDCVCLTWTIRKRPEHQWMFNRLSVLKEWGKNPVKNPINLWIACYMRK